MSQAQTEVSDDDGQAGDQAAEGLWAGEVGRPSASRRAQSVKVEREASTLDGNCRLRDKLQTPERTASARQEKVPRFSPVGGGLVG